MPNEKDPYVISVGVRDLKGDTKKVIGLLDENVTYVRRLGQRNSESNEVTVIKGRKGIALVCYNPQIHTLRFLNRTSPEHKTFESTEGFQRILPSDELEITLKSRVSRATNGDDSLYIIYDRANLKK